MGEERGSKFGSAVMYSFASPPCHGSPLSGSPEINEGKGSHPVTRRVADGPNQRDRGTPYPGLLPTPSLTAQTTEREGERALLRVPSPVLVHPPAHLYPVSPPSTYILHPLEHAGGDRQSNLLFSIQLPPPASLSREREREGSRDPSPELGLPTEGSFPFQSTHTSQAQGTFPAPIIWLPTWARSPA